MLYDRQIVCDEHVGEVVLALEILEQVDHLCLHGYVESRYRLVADDELRVHRESARDADALPLSTREFVRIAIGVLGSEANLLQESAHARVSRRTLGQLVNREPFTNDRADGHTRVEGRDRILEDDLHIASQFAQLRRAHRAHIPALESDLTGRWLDETENRSTGGGLSAAGFADYSESLAPRDVEGDIVHCLHGANLTRENSLSDRKLLAEIAHREQLRTFIGNWNIHSHAAPTPSTTTKGACGLFRRSGSTAR